MKPWHAHTWISTSVLMAMLTACTTESSGLTGTLEYDTVVIRSPAFETLTRVDMVQGQPVEAGDLLAVLDQRRQQGVLAEARAALDSAQANEALIVSGTRNEQIVQAVAAVAQARSQLTEAELDLQRQELLLAQSLTSVSAVDQAHARRDSARAQLDESEALRDERINGARSEELTVARMATRQAEARIAIEQFRLDELTLRAPVGGRVDSVPVVIGDRPQPGETLATLVTGTPYVRFYLPQAERSALAIGDTVRVWIDGEEAAISGRIRWVSDQATFTPFYALNDRDRGYLTYLAEATIETNRALPAGFPVEVMIGE